MKLFRYIVEDWTFLEIKGRLLPSVRITSDTFSTYDVSTECVICNSYNKSVLIL